MAFLRDINEESMAFDFLNNPSQLLSGSVFPSTQNVSMDFKNGKENELASNSIEVSCNNDSPPLRSSERLKKQSMSERVGKEFNDLFEKLNKRSKELDKMSIFGRPNFRNNSINSMETELKISGQKMASKSKNARLDLKRNLRASLCRNVGQNFRHKSVVSNFSRKHTENNFQGRQFPFKEIRNVVDQYYGENKENLPENQPEEALRTSENGADEIFKTFHKNFYGNSDDSDFVFDENAKNSENSDYEELNEDSEDNFEQESSNSDSNKKLDELNDSNELNNVNELNDFNKLIPKLSALHENSKNDKKSIKKSKQKHFSNMKINSFYSVREKGDSIFDEPERYLKSFKNDENSTLKLSKKPVRKKISARKVQEKKMKYRSNEFIDDCAVSDEETDESEENEEITKEDEEFTVQLKEEENAVFVEKNEKLKLKYQSKQFFEENDLEIEKLKNRFGLSFEAKSEKIDKNSGRINFNPSKMSKTKRKNFENFGKKIDRKIDEKTSNFAIIDQKFSKIGKNKQKMMKIEKNGEKSSSRRRRALMSMFKRESEPFDLFSNSLSQSALSQIKRIKYENCEKPKNKNEEEKNHSEIELTNFVANTQDVTLGCDAMGRKKFQSKNSILKTLLKRSKRENWPNLNSPKGKKKKVKKEKNKIEKKTAFCVFKAGK